MARGFNPTALIPTGVVMQSVDDTGTAVVVTVRSSTSVGNYPDCVGTSDRVYSRYTRSMADLPLSGHPVKLRVFVRRFYCDRALCTRRVLSERLLAATPWARRTAQLDEIVHHLGLVFGGCPAGSFAQQSMIRPIQDDVRQMRKLLHQAPRVAKSDAGVLAAGDDQAGTQEEDRGCVGVEGEPLAVLALPYRVQ